jgi:predicted ferric reductase
VYLGKPQELAIAKGFGLNLRILSVGMFFTMCRTTLGNLYLVAYLDKLIPLGLNLEIHSFIGINVLFHSIGHVFAHISYEYIRTDGGPRATVLQKSLTNGGWTYRLNGGDGITGYILLGIILFMSTTAMCRGLSSKFYAIFYHLHIVGYLLWITFLYLHVYSLWRWWLALVVLYMGDLCYDLIFLTTVSTLSLSRPGPDGVTFLSLYSTNHPEAGSYYRIKVPSISLTEWHSFSFAGNSSSNHLKFFIASAGDWTSALHELVSDPARRDKALVIVIGPYKAPAEKLFRNHKYEGRAKNCLVASGIGITPFLSCIATDIMNGLNAESNKDTFDALFHEDLHAVRHKTTKNDFTEEEDFAEDDETRILHVVWSIREIGELMFFIEYIYQLIKLQDNLREKIVTIDIYLTGLGSIHDPKYLIAQTFFSLIVGEKTTSNMNIFYSRPNFDNIVQKIKPRSMYYCGGALIREMLDPICAKYNIKVSSS